MTHIFIYRSHLKLEENVFFSDAAMVNIRHYIYDMSAFWSFKPQLDLMNTSLSVSYVFSPTNDT